MDAVDNGWNLLHIASQVYATILDHKIRACGVLTDDVRYLAAHEALGCADALLQAWKTTQGDDYAEDRG